MSGESSDVDQTPESVMPVAPEIYFQNKADQIREIQTPKTNWEVCTSMA